MKNTRKIGKVCLTALFLGMLGCNDSDDIMDGEWASGADLSLTPIGQLNQGVDEINSHADVTNRSSVKMNYRTRINLYPNITGGEFPNYARLKRLADGSWILFTHESDASHSVGWDVHYTTSPDLKKWTYRGMLFERYLFNTSYNPANKRVFSNANAIVLSDGELLVFASYRDNLAYKDFKYRNNSGIILVRSTDNGKTWSRPQEIYHGTNWEPHMLELPSGELQCYFTESRPWITDNHSGTSMIVSTDKGRTWTPGLNKEPYRVIRQNWYDQDMDTTLYTDQMPVVIRLNNSDKLVAVLESAVSCINEETVYNISIAYSDDNGQWRHLEEEETGPDDRQDNIFEPSSAAPFIVQFPSGETLVSYGHQKLLMRIGDAEARNFGEPMVSLQGTGYWGCMELNGSHEVVAAMRNSNNPDGKVSVEMACFELNHRISATRRNVVVDGDNEEWEKTDDALFVGEKSQAQATLRCSCDDSNVYFLVEVMDEQISEDDYVNILLSPANEGNELTSAARCISVSKDGLKGTGIYDGGAWQQTGMDDIVVKTACDGTSSNDADKDNGYLIEVAVPRTRLNLASGEILVNFVLNDSQGGEDAISLMSSHDTSKWIPIIGL